MTKHITTMHRLHDHFEESKLYFEPSQIVGLFVQGSQNYGLDYEHSDLDTKLIVAPSFKDIAMNRKPVSTTHVRENNEHIDFKDIRLYMQTFRKQNLNFLEILFTPFCWVNWMYQEQWQRLVDAREDIAHMNMYRAVQSMKGIALEKYHAMEHPYPSKLDILEKHGYDGKQLHHLKRVEDYLERYINGESYESCLRPTADIKDLLMALKRQEIPLAEARLMAEEAKAHVEAMAEQAYSIFPNEEKAETVELLDDVQYEIMKIAVEEELR